MKKEVLSDKNSKIWDDTYKRILTDYSWKMPEQFKHKIQELVK